MPHADQNHTPDGPRLSRRRLLFGGAVAGLGAAAAVGTDLVLNRPAGSSEADTTPSLNGSETVPFYGAHQAGIETVPQAHATFIGIDLNDDVDREALTRLMRLLTNDAGKLTQGAAALADSEPELAVAPARLTVTFGFGPRFVQLAGGSQPAWLAPLQSFGVDKLDPAWNDGDLLLQIAADDPLTVAHTTRMLLKDVRSFGSVRWTQPGFRRAYASEKAGTTMRNLFGQVDGTVNLEPGTADFEKLVWATRGWMAGGTSFVLRRIEMNLDKWDRLDRSGREQSVGRTLSNGAPLTGSDENDEPDFEAKTAIGFPVIAEFSHIRRARSDNPDERIYRRGYNYDGTPTGDQISNSGLLFASFQSDPVAQFVPIQQRLDDLDLLNEWITPIGSAVFAIPPGCDEGGFIGDTLLA